MTSNDIRKTFIDFWREDPRKHKLTPNVSLIPSEDSTLLFVNSGMFPLAPYLAGEEHPDGKRLTNIQRCLRTKYDELMEIGDNRHTLMFEMMGNWSLGDYFKKEQIPWVLDLHVEHYGMDINRLYVSVWEGNKDVPRDDESIDLWKQAFKKYGVVAEFSEDLSNIPKDLNAGKTHKARIFPYGVSDNWWQRGEAPGELGGPTSEIFYDIGVIEREQNDYHINDDSGRFIEIGNSVFMQYQLDTNMQWRRLKQKNVDYGGGFERVVMCVQDKSDIFETDIYEPILKKISEISGKDYKTEGKENEYTPAFRVISDHGRAAAFILADGITPSNKDQGYILRRFIRRLVRFGNKLGLERNFTADIARAVIERMKDPYEHLEKNKDTILEEITKEEEKFRATLDRGLTELEKFKESGEDLSGEVIFDLYQTYGFPFEMTIEECGVSENEVEKYEKEFTAFEKEHREKSRLGAEQKFKGGLADHSGEVIAYHTATHLLLKALQIVLGDHVHQKGSNITGDRLRFDFSHAEKLTPEQIEHVEKIVNEAIDKDYMVEFENMPYEKAKEIGAEGVFTEKYGEMVKVYKIFDKESDDVFSKELCGGPHVEHTGILKDMGTFKIKKEESSSSGVRRIKAVLE